MTIREYTKEDIPRLVELWEEAFGDRRSFIEAFYRMLPDMGSCTVGEEDGKIVAMANVLAGQELPHANSPKVPECGYLYAVAVDRDYRGRGFGAEITRAGYDLAVKREAWIICTLPADDSLREFYKKTLDFETALYRKKHELAASDVEMTMQLNETEYNLMRENLLASKTYLRLSYFAMDFLNVLCKEYGGGLFASMSGICIAQKEGDTCYLHEVISQNPEQTAASVAFALGCKKAVWYEPAETGEPFIMAEHGKIPLDAIWNIAYE